MMGACVRVDTKTRNDVNDFINYSEQSTSLTIIVFDTHSRKLFFAFGDDHTNNLP